MSYLRYLGAELSSWNSRLSVGFGELYTTNMFPTQQSVGKFLLHFNSYPADMVAPIRTNKFGISPTEQSLWTQKLGVSDGDETGMQLIRLAACLEEIVRSAHGLKRQTLQEELAEAKLIVAERQRLNPITYERALKFAAADKDGSGDLDFEEFKTHFAVAGESEAQTRATFDSVDTDHSGTISIKEYTDWLVAGGNPVERIGKKGQQDKAGHNPAFKCEGWVYIKDRLRRFQKRWFVLDYTDQDVNSGMVLNYYKKKEVADELGNPMGSVLVDGLKIEADIKESGQLQTKLHCFAITPERGSSVSRMVCGCSHAEDRTTWTTKLAGACTVKHKLKQAFLVSHVLSSRRSIPPSVLQSLEEPAAKSGLPTVIDEEEHPHPAEITAALSRAESLQQRHLNLSWRSQRDDEGKRQAPRSELTTAKPDKGPLQNGSEPQTWITDAFSYAPDGGDSEISNSFKLIQSKLDAVLNAVEQRNQRLDDFLAAGH